MLDQDFIFQICKETINKFKNLNLEELDERLHDPMYSWIQNDPDKIKALSAGEQQPLYTNSSLRGREKNRRIELIFKF